MRRGKVSEVIRATSAQVFDLMHGCRRRLEWDTLLRAAYLDDDHPVAANGATSVCVGRRSPTRFADEADQVLARAAVAS